MDVVPNDKFYQYTIHKLQVAIYKMRDANAVLRSELDMKIKQVIQAGKDAAEMEDSIAELRNTVSRLKKVNRMEEAMMDEWFSQPREARSNTVLNGDEDVSNSPTGDIGEPFRMKSHITREWAKEHEYVVITWVIHGEPEDHLGNPRKEK